MRVKGTAYHARLNLLRAKLGADGVEAFVAKYCAAHPEFPSRVIATTQIPAEDFLAFIDAIVDEVYDGDQESLWEIGFQSAEWSLTEGPYKNLIQAQDVERFASKAPVMWSNFFDTGRAIQETHSDHVDLRIVGLPPGLRHPYFEYSVVGYFKRGLEMHGVEVELERIAGFASGDEEVHYKLHVSVAEK